MGAIVGVVPCRSELSYGLSEEYPAATIGLVGVCCC